MKFTIDDEHLHYYRTHGFVEFESLFDAEQIATLVTAAKGLTTGTAWERFLQGRDLWRKNEALLKILSQRKLGEAAVRLTGKRPLRIGFDQLFPAPVPVLAATETPYEDFLARKKSLADWTSLQGVVCGLLISLDGGFDENSMLPAQPGNGVFLSPEALINFPAFAKSKDCSLYLIVYTDSKSVYIYNRQDTHARAFGRLGYNIGDRLSDEKNPIVFK